MSLTHSLPGCHCWKNTTTEHSEILVNLVTYYQSGGETLPNQQKDKDEDKDKDKDKDRDKDKDKDKDKDT